MKMWIEYGQFVIRFEFMFTLFVLIALDDFSLASWICCGRFQLNNHFIHFDMHIEIKLFVCVVCICVCLCIQHTKMMMRVFIIIIIIIHFFSSRDFFCLLVTLPYYILYTLWVCIWAFFYGNQYLRSEATHN